MDISLLPFSGLQSNGHTHNTMYEWFHSHYAKSQPHRLDRLSMYIEEICDKSNLWQIIKIYISLSLFGEINDSVYVCTYH